MRSGRLRAIGLAATLLGIGYLVLRAVAGKATGEPAGGKGIGAAKRLGARPATAPHRPARWAYVGGAAAVAAVLAGGIFAYVKSSDADTAVAVAMTGGDPARAPALMRRYGCAGCHAIPGVPGADGKVAPGLSNLRERVFVGGVVRNTPGDLRRWIVHPQAFSAHSAMPRTGITDEEARDVVAYLYAR